MCFFQVLKYGRGTHFKLFFSRMKNLFHFPRLDVSQQWPIGSFDDVNCYFSQQMIRWFNFCHIWDYAQSHISILAKRFSIQSPNPSNNKEVLSTGYLHGIFFVELIGCIVGYLMSSNYFKSWFIYMVLIVSAKKHVVHSENYILYANFHPYCIL